MMGTYETYNHFQIKGFLIVLKHLKVMLHAQVLPQNI